MQIERIAEMTLTKADEAQIADLLTAAVGPEFWRAVLLQTAASHAVGPA